MTFRNYYVNSKRHHNNLNNDEEGEDERGV